MTLKAIKNVNIELEAHGMVFHLEIFWGQAFEEQTLTNDQRCYQQHPLSQIGQQFPWGFLHTYRWESKVYKGGSHIKNRNMVKHICLADWIVYLEVKLRILNLEKQNLHLLSAPLNSPLQLCSVPPTLFFCTEPLPILQPYTLIISYSLFKSYLDSIFYWFSIYQLVGSYMHPIHDITCYKNRRAENATSYATLFYTFGLWVTVFTNG